MSLDIMQFGEPPKKPWGNYDFSKDSKAVIAFRKDWIFTNGTGIVLWAVGGHIRMEMEEYCVDFGDLGLKNPERDGIWIWKGRSVAYPGSYEHPDDGGIELVGSYYLPTNDEWMAIRRGECPWNDEDWKLPEKEKP